jgi:hypothetical protein
LGTKQTKSTLEAQFNTLWHKRFSQHPLIFGAVGSLMVIGIDSTRSQVDFYCPESKVIVEIHGATHKGRAGAHSSGTGIRRDMVKQLLAQVQGWAFFELDSTMLKNTLVLDKLAEFIQARKQGKNSLGSLIAWKQWQPLMPKSRAKKAKPKTKAAR